MASVNIERHDVINCSRCGQDHKQVAFFEFTGNPIEDKDGTIWNFWAYCPKYFDPILMNKTKKENEQDMANPIYAKLQEMAEENLTADKVFELFEAEQIAVELQIRPDRILRYVATTCDKKFVGDTAWSALWQAWAYYYESVKEHSNRYIIVRMIWPDTHTVMPEGGGRYATLEELEIGALALTKTSWMLHFVALDTYTNEIIPNMMFSRGKKWVEA